MKKLLIILLFVSANVFGQTTRMSTLADSVTKLTLSGTLSGSYYPFSSTLITDTSKYDTIRIIMLACDTTSIGISNFQVRLYQNLFYQYGYEVRSVHCCVNGYSGFYAIYQAENYYEYECYLDENKKPLSKSIIVWQSKEL